MTLHILDPHISLITNIFVIIANITGILCSFPQLYTTYKTKNTESFSTSSMFLGLITYLIWLCYGIELKSFPVVLYNSISTFYYVFLLYYMYKYPTTPFFIKLNSYVNSHKIYDIPTEYVLIDINNNINDNINNNILSDTDN